MKTRILIADDDRFFQKRIAECFDSTLFDTTIVGNGHDALQHLMSHNYDLAVIDFHLPVKNGGEILAEAFRQGSETPIIVVTGDDSLETERIVRSNHGAYFFIKPFMPEDLQSVAFTILKHTQIRDLPTASALAVNHKG